MSTYRPNAPFVNYFFLLAPDPESGANIPNAGGTLTFYDDNNRSPSGLLATYSDVSDPENPVVNDNPLELGADGSAPLIYFQDKLYYIVEKDSNGVVVRTYEHFYYPYTGNGGGGNGNENQNYVPDGQFIFPIDFTQSTNPIGTITQPKTPVSWSVDFYQDPNTTTKNVVTFESISNESIQSSPPNQVVLTSQSVMAGETQKDFKVTIGDVNFCQASQPNANPLSISLEGYSKIGGAPIVTVLAEKNYGNGGSPTETTTIATFTLNNQRTQYWYNQWTPDSNEGKTIGEGSTLSIIWRIALGQICQVAITNLLVSNSVAPTQDVAPVYPIDGLSKIAAHVWGDNVRQQMSNTGLQNIYQPYVYTATSDIINQSNTGKLFLALKTASFPDAVRCDHSQYKTTDYNDIQIPYARLYKGQPGSIGNAFGSSGDLVVTSSNNVVTFTLEKGGREKTPYTNGTTGAALTVVQTYPGLRYGVSCSLKNGTSDTVVVTWLTKFTAVAPPYVSVGAFTSAVASVPAPPAYGSMVYVETIPPSSTNIGNYFETYGQSYPGSGLSFGAQAPGFFTITDTAVGSPSVNASSEIKFNSVPGPQYIPSLKNYSFSGINVNYYQGILEWATDPDDTYYPGVNQRARAIGSGWAQGAQISGVSVGFIVNGDGGQQYGGVQTVSISVLESDSISQVVNKFIYTINNPFIDTVTVNSTPAAGTYFLFSSDTIDYYGWFKVDGVGTDPAVASRTAVEIDISASDTTTQIATKIVNAMDQDVSIYFNVPDETNSDHVPYPVPADCLTGYFIYL